MQARIEKKFDDFDHKNTISSITGDYWQDRISISRVVSKAYKNVTFSKSSSLQSGDLNYTLSLRIESTQD